MFVLLLFFSPPSVTVLSCPAPPCLADGGALPDRAPASRPQRHRAGRERVRGDAAVPAGTDADVCRAGGRR